MNRCFRMLASSLAITMLLSCASQVFSDARIDHLVIGISKLEDGIAELESLTGQRAVIGGEHPGRGTHNALVAVGPRTYIEVIAPLPEASELITDFQLLGLSQLTPAGFAVGTDDIEALARHLQGLGFATTAPQPGARVRPDGSRLEWRSIAISEPQLAGAPFFIQWGDLAYHPAKTSPAAGRLRSVQIMSPDAAELGRLLRGLNLRRVVARQANELSMRLLFEVGEGVVVIPQR